MASLRALLLEELGEDVAWQPDGADGAMPRRAPREMIAVVAARLSPGEVAPARDALVAGRAGEVAVARLASGRLVVVDDACPHDGGPLSDGFVEGERLVCARHNWELEVDGATAGGARACARRDTVRRCKAPR